MNAENAQRIVPEDVRISDFGITRRLDSTSNIPDVLSLRYAAPEVVFRGEIGPPSDIFALGVVIWECFSGQKAWSGVTDEGVRESLRTDTRPSLAAIRVPDNCRDDLNRLIGGCWRRESHKRPPVAHVIAALEALHRTCHAPAPSHGGAAVTASMSGPSRSSSSSSSSSTPSTASSAAF